MRDRKPIICLVLTGVCVLITIVCVAYIIKYYAGRQKGEELYESLQSSVVGIPITSSEPNPDDEATKSAVEIPDDESLYRKVDFTVLQSDVDTNIYAWIFIPDTQIDYPVLQHPSDDTYYLNYNIDGSRGYPGCIYTEKENAMDFMDFNTVIYGHNMKNGTMFHDLHKYEDESFLSDHPYVYIYMPDKVLRYQIFAAYRYDDRHLLYSFDYASDAGRRGYLSEIFNIRSMSAVLDEQVPVTSNDRIITLSTCVGNQDENRYLVQAVLINDISATDIN